MDSMVCGSIPIKISAWTTKEAHDNGEDEASHLVPTQVVVHLHSSETTSITPLKRLTPSNVYLRVGSPRAPKVYLNRENRPPVWQTPALSPSILGHCLPYSWRRTVWQQHTHLCAVISGKNLIEQYSAFVLRRFNWLWRRDLTLLSGSKNAE